MKLNMSRDVVLCVLILATFWGHCMNYLGVKDRTL